MNVKLSPELERRVAAHVASHAEFPTAEALVERAIEVMLNGEDLDLQAALADAEQQIDSGDYLEFHSDTLSEVSRDVHARGLARQPKE